MRYVVGYTARQHGQSVLNFAASLARDAHANLDIVVILPRQTGSYEVRNAVDEASAAFEKRGRAWLTQARAQLPSGLAATGRLYHSESVAQGLIEAAVDTTIGAPADLIVVGPTSANVRGHFTVGSVAADLLHAAPVPVALVPFGTQACPRISRFTTIIGTRQGAEALVDVSARSVAKRGIALRLVSLAELDTAEFMDHEASVERATAYVAGLMDNARKLLPPGCALTSVVGHGRRVEDAVEKLDFHPDEIVVLGSSRLAASNKLFIGASAHRLLHVLPVPMVVVPRDYRVASEQTNTVVWSVTAAAGREGAVAAAPSGR